MKQKEGSGHGCCPQGIRDYKSQENHSQQGDNPEGLEDKGITFGGLLVLEAYPK